MSPQQRDTQNQDFLQDEPPIRTEVRSIGISAAHLKNFGIGTLAAFQEMKIESRVGFSKKSA
jgi:hypothetical protein